MLRRCPNCQRRLLKTSSILAQPTRFKILCEYCGSEFKMSKSWLFIALTIALWNFAILCFLVIGTLNIDVIFKTFLSGLIFLSAIYITPHLGRLNNLRKYGHEPDTGYSFIAEGQNAEKKMLA